MLNIIVKYESSDFVHTVSIFPAIKSPSLLVIYRVIKVVTKGTEYKKYSM